MKRIRILTWVAAVMAMGAANVPAAIWYVDANVTGGVHDGTTWATAYPDLQQVLPSLTIQGDEIWVAQGTYKPGVSRSDTFLIQRNRSLYGGFTNGMAQLTDRNPALYPTILSGDINGDDGPNFANRSDNSYHVINNIGETRVGVRIDGFIIRGGNADALGVDDQGAGAFIDSCTDIVIANCVFVDNSAEGSGALLLKRSVNGSVQDCVFSGNRATSADTAYGAGALGGASPQNNIAHSNFIQRCYFTGNTSGARGGAGFVTSSLWPVHFVNCLMAGNTAVAGGGALYLRLGTNTIWNCTIAGNSPEGFVTATTNGIYINNTIVWTNDIAGFNEYDTAGGGTFVPTFSDINGGAFAGINGNIKASPVWGAGTSGTWTASSVYTPATGLTKLTRGTAAWPVNAFAGMTVNPDVTQKRQFLIKSNTATEISVWGDASTIAQSADTFKLWDYGLANGSPCIDTGTNTGAPADDITKTSRPKGAAADMGAFESSATGTVAGVIYVKANAIGGNNGSSWQHAYTTLTQALANAVSDVNQIWVAAGTYKPGVTRASSFNLVHRVPVYGGFAGTESSTSQRTIAANPTILSGDINGNDTGNWGSRADNAYHVVQSIANASKNVRLDGFIIRGGNADGGTDFDPAGQGGGLFSENPDSLTIDNCKFIDNSAVAGGAVYIKRPLAGGIRIEDTVFSGNRATEAANNHGGGAICGQGNTGTTTVERVVFAGNLAAGSIGGGLSYLATEPLRTRIVNSLVAGNRSGYNDGGGAQGGGLMLRSTNAQGIAANVLNCTIGFNEPYGITSKDTIPVMQNSIVWDNTAGELLVLNQSVSAQYSDIDEAGYDGFNGNIRQNPLFGSVSNGIVLTATYNPLTGLSTLSAGVLTLWQPNEFVGRAVNPDLAQNLQFWIASNSANSLTVWGDITTAGSGPADSFRVYDYHLSGASPCIDAGFQVGAPAQDLELAARPAGITVDIGAYEFGGSALFSNGVAFVDVDATGANDGSSWSNAFTKLQSALAVVPGGREIWVAEGTYKPDVGITNSFRLKASVAVYGGFAGTELTRAARNPATRVTILSGDISGNDGSDNLAVIPNANRADNVRHVVTGVDAATLDGFVIIGGYAYNASSDVDPQSTGGGLYLNSASPTIRNIVFADNFGRSGGALAVLGTASPTIEACVFSGNWSENGAAAYCEAAPTFSRCAFVGGYAQFNAGALFFSGTRQPIVQNCVFSGNYSESSGAIRIGAAGSNSVKVINCTLAHNESVFNGAIFVKLTNQASVVNSILWRNNATDAGGADEIGFQFSTPGSLAVSYSDVTGGYAGAGNINTNPVFLSSASGSLSTVAAFNVTRRQTTLYAAGGAFGLLSGQVVNPNTNQWRRFTIVSNTSTSLTVWGNAALVAAPGNPYVVQNYDLAQNSPCANTGTGAGAPTRDYLDRPRPAGAGFDMGAFEVQPPPTKSMLLIVK